MIKKLLSRGLNFLFTKQIEAKVHASLQAYQRSQALYLNKAYSQEGEDLIIKRYFEGIKKQLFYVDVGAHHPLRFSNTAIFYETGSKGINIEANQPLLDLFKIQRPQDVNIHCGVGKNTQIVKFYEFEEPALSTFSEEIYKERVGKGLPLKQEIAVEIRTLASILDQYADNQEIDFLNIDVEGWDFDVLESNNWNKFRPKLILIELRDFNLSEGKHPVSSFLESKGYSLFAKTYKTVFFERKD